MNHLTTEPTESKSVAGPQFAGAMATAEKEASSIVAGETVVTNQSRKKRPILVPPLDPTIGIELRVTRAGMPARRLRINAARCTFGSGEGCTVRLSDASLRPLHAVILRDSGRILIRGYSVPLEVNGQFVAEASLALGDVIRLGQYCFEMIDLPPSSVDDDRYEDETVAPTSSFGNVVKSVPVNVVEQVKSESEEHQIAIDESHPSEPTPNPKRLTFSQPPGVSRAHLPHRSASQSLLEGLQSPSSGVDGPGRAGAVNVEEHAVREPATSLAQIHVQAKRNAELMAELSAVRKREEETNEKLATTVQHLEAAQNDIADANQSIVALQNEIESLNEKILKVSNDAKEQQAIATAEQAKLNRAIASLRESGAASQKAEAATRQSLQESIRQRDEAFAQRAMSIDAQQLTRAKLDEAEAQIRRMNQDAEEASNLLSRFESEAETSRLRIDELKDVCCGQADQITKLAAALEASQSSEIAAVTELKNTIDQLQKELDASLQRVKIADLERVQLDTLQSTLDSTLQEHISEKLGWSTQADTLNQKLERLSFELQSTKDDLNRSQIESANYQSQIEELRSFVADIETELSSRPTAEQLKEAQSQLALTESDLESSQRQLTQLREDYDQLASQRVAQESSQASTLQSQAVNAPLPSKLFPVPAFSDSKLEDEFPVEATHASNIQSLIASSFASHGVHHPDAASHGEAGEKVEHWQTSSPSSDDRGNVAEPDQSPMCTSHASGASTPDERHRDDIESSNVNAQALSLGGAGEPSNRLSPAHQRGTLTNDEATPVSESSWKTPSGVFSNASSAGWSIGNSKGPEDEPLQPPAVPVADREDPTVESETQSQWLTSSHSPARFLPSDSAEESLHTEPMNRHSGPMLPMNDEGLADEQFSPIGRFESADIKLPAYLGDALTPDSAASVLVEEESSHQAFAKEDSNAEDESLLADLIKRSESPASHWFADYTASQTANDETNESGDLEDAEDSQDNDAILERLNQYVRNNQSTNDEIGDVIADSQYNGLDPEASALSLARMLISELDSASQSDPDLTGNYSGPDPLVESKRLVGVSVSEEGDSSDDIQDDYQSPHVEMRRKEFDERAFRNSFADSPNVEGIDPNADEAAYSIQSDTDRSTDNRSAASPQIDEQDEEDSVEAYMNQLLRRMGQEPISAPKPIEEPAKPVPAKTSEPKPQEINREKPEIVRPKRTPAELEVPMDRMRELANQSAESAISTSNRKGAKELRSRAAIDGIQASVVVVCAAVFFYCGMTSSNLSLVWNTAGTLAIALSGFFFYEMFRKIATIMKHG